MTNSKEALEANALDNIKQIIAHIETGGVINEGWRAELLVIRAALEAQAEKDRVMWIDAYMRGFKQSAEGWNGEICLDNELEKVRQQAITEYNKLKGE